MSYTGPHRQIPVNGSGDQSGRRDGPRQTRYEVGVSVCYRPHSALVLRAESRQRHIRIIPVIYYVWPSTSTFMSSTRMDLSSEQLIRYFPEGWKSTERTQLSWVGKTMSRVPWDK